MTMIPADIMHRLTTHFIHTLYCNITCRNNFIMPWSMDATQTLEKFPLDENVGNIRQLG